MKKLFQINECLGLSTGKIAQQIGEVAIEHGWDSWIAYSGREPYVESKSHIIGIGNFIDGCLHYAGYRLFDGEGLYSKYYTKTLVEKIKKVSPDIILLHNIHDHWLNYPLLFDYFSTLDIPIVWVQHDCWSFTGGCMYFDMIGCDNWKTGCKKCPDKRTIIVNQSERNFKLMSDHLSKIKNLVYVPVSYWLKNLMLQSSQSARKMLTIHNGIDLNAFNFNPNRKNTRDKFRILGVAGVWAERKGLGDFVKLRAKLPDEYEILLVGLSEKQRRQLPHGIIGIGRTQTTEELAAIYADSDVYVNPTYSDNFPTTNIESLACGTPVITYNTGGSPEAIDNKTGIIVNQGDVNTLALSIMKLREYPLSPTDCRKRAVDFFDKNKCFSKYIQLFEDLLNANYYA